MAESLLLTKDERVRFSNYCRMEVSSLDGVIAQMRKMSMPIPPDMARRAVAYSVVADDLERTEGGEV